MYAVRKQALTIMPRPQIINDLVNFAPWMPPWFDHDYLFPTDVIVNLEDGNFTVKPSLLKPCLVMTTTWFSEGQSPLHKYECYCHDNGPLESIFTVQPQVSFKQSKKFQHGLATSQSSFCILLHCTWTTFTSNRAQMLSSDHKKKMWRN